MKKKQLHLTWLLLLCVFSLLIYLIQTNIALNKDVASLLHTATQILQGQTYAHDIFEINPPLIFYIYSLPVIISKITGFKTLYIFHLYVLTLIFTSVVCSRALFSGLFKPKRLLIDFITYGLMLILLILPGAAFGQREHFLLIFTIPYIFLAACRLEHKVVNPCFALLIGLMAGIGFSIKPFFLTTLVLIELLFVYRTKNLLGWIRIESVSASLVIVSYGLSMIFLFPDYWHIVVPLSLPYYQAIVMPWSDLLTSLPFLFCCASFLFWVYTFKKEASSAMAVLVGLSILGYIISYLIPRVAWYYHILPALSMACLYFVLIFGELAEQIFQQSKRLLDSIVATCLVILVFFMPVQYCMTSMIDAIHDFHSNSLLHQLTTLFNQHPKNNTYIFLSMTHELYALEFYSSAHHVGSFSLCAWEYGPFTTPDHDRRLSYALNVISHDLDEKKPGFVIVDIPSTRARLHRTVDFPKVYSKNKQFHDAWSHYHYFKSVKPYDIYQRVS